MFIPLSDSNTLKHIKLQYVTLGLIATNALIWVVTGTPSFMSDSAVRAAFLSYGFIPDVALGEAILPIEFQRIPTWASYVSYSFLHGDFMHLAGNMLFLWVFGDNIEDAMGHLRFLVFFLLCAAAGALVHGMAAPTSSSPLIGASGATAGVIGAYLLIHPNIKVWVLALGRIPLRIPAGFVLGAWILLQLYSYFSDGDSNISWAAHIGGFSAGIVLVFLMKRPETGLFGRTYALPDSTRTHHQPNNTLGDLANSQEFEEPKRPAPSVPTIQKPVRKWGRNGDA